MAQVSPVQLQKFLGGIDYPARKDDLVRVARSKGADDDVLETLRELPIEQFNGPSDVNEALGRMS